MSEPELGLTTQALTNGLPDEPAGAGPAEKPKETAIEVAQTIELDIHDMLEQLAKSDADFQQRMSKVMASLEGITAELGEPRKPGLERTLS